MRALIVPIVPILALTAAGACSKKEPAKNQPVARPAEPPKDQPPPTMGITPPPAKPTADPTPAFDPCSLLSVADIEAATKEKTEAKVSTEVYAPGFEPPAWPHRSRCVYSLPGERGRKIAVVDIDRYESPAQAKAEWERLFKGKGSVPIPGVGDDASWSLPDARFLKGRFVVDVRRELLDGREQQISTALAKRAFTKVP